MKSRFLRILSTLQISCLQEKSWHTVSFSFLGRFHLPSWSERPFQTFKCRDYNSIPFWTFGIRYRGVRLKSPLSPRPDFWENGTVFYFQMFEICWAGYYFLRSPPKIFWRFAPKHIDFAFKYGSKCPKFFGASRRVNFSPRVTIFFQKKSRGYYFFSKMF